ncbi:LacI family DNA-binding transcriptional regulator [Arthrobacter sp. N199823]|uniref:LacI family DNA-binding transcriptional regulator n=1 Tax=Arthrobacter sp. N199823 TaxID=2058895 RepID=UPI000CE53EEE|nr:LacI family DNA-binding transcriptional regulator [Arthrobacter sp. N199823]
MTSVEPGKGAHTVTMRDVAKAAGVSVATVSVVVNNKPGARIGDEARHRVLEVVAQLGYRPNMLAQTLANGTSRFIGLVADAIATTPFAGQIIHGAQDEAWKNGYVLLVANTDGNQAAEDEAIAMMLEHQVHGILYSSWYHREITVPATLHQTDTVLVNCFAAGSGLPSVVPDEEEGGRTATRELLDAGHTKIAFINTTTPSPAQSGRLAGYRAALEAAGLSYEESLVFPAAPEQEGGYASTPSIINSGATAVFCHNDRVAMGLYDGLREQGLRIPEDIAVMGFDNQDVIAAHLRPPLSTVALPHYELGAAGIRMLLGIEHSSDTVPTRIACPPIPRQSI